MYTHSLRLPTSSAAVLAVVLATQSLHAQIDQLRLFQQQQQRQQSQTGVVSQQGSSDESSANCLANPDDPECTGMEQDDQDDFSTAQPIRSRTRRVPGNFPGSNAADGLPTRGDTETIRRTTSTYRVNEPPTEFQRFVRSSTGRLLPLFGANLFDRVPTTFAPVERVPVSADYTVGPGDELDIRVWGQVNFNQRLSVDRTGDIFLPQVGRIAVAGLKMGQLHEAVKAAIGRVYRNFDLSVNMGKLRSIQIFVLGQARRPGGYTVSSLSTFVNALFASGGPSVRGSMRNIQLKRNGQIVATVDLYDLLLNGDKSKDVPLLPGDVLFIPSVGQRVAITGSVETPAIYEIKDGAALTDVVTYAGGLSSMAAARRAMVDRIDQQSSMHSEEIALTTAGLQTKLQGGDIVRILSVIPRFDKTVTVRGNVADPVRFPWRAGMKISDLIPNKEFLLTREFWRERNTLAKRDERDTASTRSGDAVESDSSLQVQPAASMNGVGKTTNQVIRSYREETRNTKSDTSFAAAVSGQEAPPVRRFDWKNDLQPSAPEIDWNYAAIERIDPQTLATHLVPFNLGKAVVDRDQSADMELEAGDVVTIFSSADIATPRDQQTKYVRIEGEVKMAGVYTVHPGETLRHIVNRAGGLTTGAYLFGAQFTRETTRREQERRYADFLNQLERDINQSASTLSGRVISVEQTAAAQTTLASERAMVEKLRQTPATGRIVLDLKPESTGGDALPELALENGDRLYVPATPSTVNVVGMVYNQASFMYNATSHVENYLHDAGGPSRYADKGHMFVIRADGSVVAKTSQSHLFGNGFTSLAVHPGDTVVVPTNVNKQTLLRNVIDWSQVVSNFGLGAAAINVLR